MGNAHKETGPKNLEDFLKDKFPNTKFIIEEIIKDENNKSTNKSFKLGFDFKILSEIQKAEIWPNDIVVRRYRFFRKQNEHATKSTWRASQNKLSNDIPNKNIV